MTGKTHLLGGALVAMLLAPNSIEGSSLILLGSLISDIDHPKSTIGKYIPLIPRLLPHRGLTHSMIFCVSSKWSMTICGSYCTSSNRS